MINLYKKWSQAIKALPASTKASTIFAVAGVVQKGISFLVVPIYTRLMSTNEYGEYSVFLSWYSIIMIFATLNMWNYLINNGLTEFKDDENNFLASLQGLSTLITIIIFLIYIPLERIWEKTTGLSIVVMIFMFIELLVMPSFEYWCSANRYHYNAKAVAFMSLAVSIATPIITVPLIMVSNNKGTAAIIGRCATASAFYAIAAYKLAQKSKKFCNKAYWLYALRFNIPLVPHFLSMIVLQSSDRIMIERICGSSDAAVYSVAYLASAALNIFNAAILNAFIPYSYQALNSDSYNKIRDRSCPLLMLIGCINILLVLWGPEVIAIMAPKQYAEAVYVIPPVAMSNLFMFLFNLFANIEYYYKETKLVAVASGISATLNVALNFIFIHRFGYIAAGYTTLICYVLFSVGHYYLMKHVLKKHLKGEEVYDIKKMTVIVLAFTSISLACSILYYYHLWYIRYLLMVSVLIVAIVKKQLVYRYIR